MMGRSLNSVPDDSNLATHLKKSERYQLIQQVTADFWSRWTQEVTPASVVRQRWHDTGRNLQVGDLVLVHDKSEVMGTYILGKLRKSILVATVWLVLVGWDIGFQTRKIQ